MTERRRVAGLIERDGHILMVRERQRGSSGRHDGPEYWTLPGGGVEPEESADEAVRREVREETGLTVTAVRLVFDAPYPSGHTEVFAVDVAPGEPVLDLDPDRGCDCPLMVGLEWLPAEVMQGELVIPCPPSI